MSQLPEIPGRDLQARDPIFEGIIPRLSTFIFNYAQLGLVLTTVGSVSNNLLAILTALFFEFGILLDSFIGAGRMWHWVLLITISSSGIALSPLAYELSQSVGTILILVSVSLFSLATKRIRTQSHAVGPVKRSWRALGYLSAGLFMYWHLVVLVSILVASILFAGLASRRDPQLQRGNLFDTSLMASYVLVSLHHVHYFSYAYVLLLVSRTSFSIPPEYLGLFFYVGWLGYYWLGRVHSGEYRWLATGHLMAGSAVLALVWLDTFELVTLLWFITGVGGGTIILLRDARAPSNSQAYHGFKIWEAIGHLVGLACASAAIFLDWSHLAYFIGALAGLLVGVGAIFMGRARP